MKGLRKDCDCLGRVTALAVQNIATVPLVVYNLPVFAASSRKIAYKLHNPRLGYRFNVGRIYYI